MAKFCRRTRGQRRGWCRGDPIKLGPQPISVAARERQQRFCTPPCTYSRKGESFQLGNPESVLHEFHEVRPTTNETFHLSFHPLPRPRYFECHCHLHWQINRLIKLPLTSTSLSRRNLTGDISPGQNE